MMIATLEQPRPRLASVPAAKVTARPAAESQPLAKPIDVAAGESVYREGDAATVLYVLLTGRVRLSTRAGTGPTLVTGLLRPGALFGLDSLSQASHSETATAEMPSTVQAVPVDLLDRLLAQRRGFAVRLMEAIVRRRSAAERLLTRALVSGVPGRLAGALLDAADGRTVHAQTRRQLAEAAWTTRETATRMLFQFEDAGLVRVHGRSVELLDLERLRRLASGEHQRPAA